jgi:methane/ammonia monooxygenase subunit B
MTGIFAGRLTKLSVAGWLGVVVSLLGCCIGTDAYAHGERNQEPFLRMRTAHFYDVKWSTDKLAVGDTLTVTGKFRLFQDWPNNLPKPETAFLGSGTSGPVFARVESYINGEPAIQSGKLELNRDYDFKTVYKARQPGLHHVHAMLNVSGAGAILGPGEWVEITGKESDFKLPVTTLDGTQIADLSTWGLGTVVKWHLLWIVAVLVYLLWFIRKPMLLPRYLVIEEGDEDTLITRGDRIWGACFLVGSILTVLLGVQWANAAYPNTVPLQSGVFRVDPLPKGPQDVSLKFKKAVYDVPGRSMRITVEVTNNGQKPVQIGEFTTAGLRFVNHSVPAAMAGVDPTYPKDLVPPGGLKISDDTPIAPGETRTVTLDATDAAWEIERLTALLSDPDNRVGGLIFFFDSDGQRTIANVYGPIVPNFTHLQAAN